MDLSEVNEQSDDELSNRSFNERKPKLNDKRLSLGAIQTESKFKGLDDSSRKVKFTNFEDSDSNDDRKENINNSDSQYESQDSNGTPKMNNVRHRKISPCKQSYGRKISENHIETISQYVGEDQPRMDGRKISVSAPPTALNRRDSKLQIFADPESGVS